MPESATPRLHDVRFSGVERLAQLALLVLAFAAFFKQSWGNAALGVLLVLTLCQARTVWPRLKVDPWWWATVCWLVFILGYAAVLGLAGNPSNLPLIDATTDYLKLAFLPGLLVGYWIQRLPGLIRPLLWLIPAGMMLRVALRIDGPMLQRLLSGEDRAAFGNSPLLLGIWALVIVLLGSHLLADHLHRFRHGGGWRSVAALAGAACTMLFGGLLMAFTQTRTAWLLALILVPLHLFVCWRLGAAVRRRSRWPEALFVGGLALGFLALLWFVSGPVAARFDLLGDPAAALLSGDISQVHDVSLAVRLEMFREALVAWWQHPWLGWGPGADAALLAASPDYTIRDFGFYHFHNDFLIFLAEYGVPGALLALSMFAVPTARALPLLCQDRERRTLVFTMLVVLLVIAVGANVSRLLVSSRGPYMMALVIGVLLALRWRAGEAAMIAPSRQRS